MRNVNTWRIPASLILAAAALWLVREARAVDPPRPDFFWPYGIVQLDGANLSPAEQPVVAFVGGTACGSAMTKVALAGQDVPAGDVGKTVYVVDVLADGAGRGQRAGCGRVGQPVTLYFPASGRIASFHPTFQVGGLRVDVALTQVLGERRMAVQVSADGTE